MKLLTMPSPLPRLPRPPVAYRIARLAIRAPALLLARPRRPRLAFAASDFDFGDLGADAPHWLAQLVKRDA